MAFSFARMWYMEHFGGEIMK